MELLDILQQITENSQRASQPTELEVGTVVSESPLEISINSAMDALKEPILYLTESVVEKKIPILSHSHETGGLSHRHTVGGLSHTHGYIADEGTHTTDSALSGSYPTSSDLGGEYQSSSALDNIVCMEHGKPLPIEDGYIILNRKLTVGDRVLLLRVKNGQEFIVLSRIF